MNDHDKQSAETRQQVGHDEISRRAEELWRQYGCPQGRDEAIWLEAEQQLLGTQHTLASSSPAAEDVGASAQQDSGNRSGSNEDPASPKAREVELMNNPVHSSVLGGSGSLGGIGGGPAKAPSSRNRGKTTRGSGK